MTSDNTLLNAIIGAVATVVLSFTGVSPALGGAVAGYLEGGETADGAKVGGLSGLLASLPVFGLILLFFALIPIAPEPGVILGGGLLILLIISVVVAYTVVLSAVGGVIGVYLKNEFEN